MRFSLIFSIQITLSTCVLSFIILSCKMVGSKTNPTSEIQAQEQNRKLIGPGVDLNLTPLNISDTSLNLARRTQIAWQTTKELFTPVKVSTPNNKVSTTIPLWQTWYDSAEFELIFEIFLRNYRQIRDNEAAIEKAIDETFSEYLSRDLTPYWTKKIKDTNLTRFEKLLGQLQEAEDLRGLNGVRATGFTLFSPALIKHYLKNYRKILACDETSTECFTDEFPANAVAIKTSWVKSNDPLSVVAEESLVPSIVRNIWIHSGNIQLNSNNTYTVNQRDGLEKVSSFHLVGMHIMTKQLPNWFWITLWWTQDQNNYFAAQNPFLSNDPFFVMKNYNLCAVTDYKESPEFLKSAEGSPYEDISKQMKDSSYCSNPYIETEPGTISTNCIGCHQNAGPGAKVKITNKDENSKHLGKFLWSFDHSSESFKKSIGKVSNQ